MERVPVLGPLFRVGPSLPSRGVGGLLSWVGPRECVFVILQKAPEHPSGVETSALSQVWLLGQVGAEGCFEEEGSTCVQCVCHQDADEGPEGLWELGCGE